ncbi:hypothetical protein CDAR_491901 [Caerostris darwini]|uniref:Uncharacterized protein n=1 Tax=Caerostris darwini TaxID=1538125 RepID=A0AAV4MYE8_9ARAC|nr:hypothetical protein CDAR_491901 [Caerostris darwini]
MHRSGKDLVSRQCLLLTTRGQLWLVALRKSRVSRRVRDVLGEEMCEFEDCKCYCFAMRGEYQSPSSLLPDLDAPRQVENITRVEAVDK